MCWYAFLAPKPIFLTKKVALTIRLFMTGLSIRIFSGSCHFIPHGSAFVKFEKQMSRSKDKYSRLQNRKSSQASLVTAMPKNIALVSERSFRCAEKFVHLASSLSLLHPTCFLFIDKPTHSQTGLLRLVYCSYSCRNRLRLVERMLEGYWRSYLDAYFIYHPIDEQTTRFQRAESSSLQCRKLSRTKRLLNLTFPNFLSIEFINQFWPIWIWFFDFLNRSSKIFSTGLNKQVHSIWFWLFAKPNSHHKFPKWIMVGKWIRKQTEDHRLEEHSNLVINCNSPFWASQKLICHAACELLYRLTAANHP